MISYTIYFSFSLFILQCQRSSCLVNSTVCYFCISCLGPFVIFRALASRWQHISVITASVGLMTCL